MVAKFAGGEGGGKTKIGKMGGLRGMMTEKVTSTRKTMKTTDSYPSRSGIKDQTSQQKNLSRKGHQNRAKKKENSYL